MCELGSEQFIWRKEITGIIDALQIRLPIYKNYLPKSHPYTTLAIRKERGVKKRSKLPTNSNYKTTDVEKGGVKNREKLPTFFMDGP